MSLRSGTDIDNIIKNWPVGIRILVRVPPKSRSRTGAVSLFAHAQMIVRHPKTMLQPICMYGCMYYEFVCMYVCLFMCVYICLYIMYLNIQICTHLYARMIVRHPKTMLQPVFMYGYIYKYICIPMCMTYTYICKYTYIYIYVYIHIYIYKYMYIYIWTVLQPYD
jgi:hypothetical protein